MQLKKDINTLIKFVVLFFCLFFVGCVMDYADYSVTFRNEAKTNLLVFVESSKEKRCDTLKIYGEMGIEPCYFCSWAQYFDSNDVFLVHISYLDLNRKDTVFVLRKNILDSIDNAWKRNRKAWYINVK